MCYGMGRLGPITRVHWSPLFPAFRASSSELVSERQASVIMSLLVHIPTYTFDVHMRNINTRARPCTKACQCTHVLVRSSYTHASPLSMHAEYYT